MISTNSISINQKYQKENNISIILRALCSDDECSRVKLSEITGLTQASITKLINQLIARGVVSERGALETDMGRKPIRLHLNTEKFNVCAVRINREYITCAIYDMACTQISMKRCSISPQDGVQMSVERLISLVSSLLKNAGPVMSIGVAVPGPFNATTGKISLMSGFPGWCDICLQTVLEEAFRLPVFVEQDANCGALAEIWHSDADANDGLMFVAADRGIGAGLILNSALYRGKDGFAGEIGHSSINVFGPRCECGNRGCLELYGSSNALEKTYCDEVFRLSGHDSDAVALPAQEIIKLVRQGDKSACNAYRKTVTYLCFGIVGMINALNPGTVVFSDRLTDSGDFFLQIANQTLGQYLLPEIYAHMRIKTCTIAGDAMLLGAGVLAFENMLQKPTAFFMVNSE